jgi:hypothetical protein
MISPQIQGMIPSRRVLRKMSKQTVWKIFGALLIASTLFAAGTQRATQRAPQLTLNWVDNAGGAANFIIERKMAATGTYARIATTAPGSTSYTDLAVVVGTTYCYRVKAANALGESGYSNEACGSPGAELAQH